MWGAPPCGAKPSRATSTPPGGLMPWATWVRCSHTWHSIVFKKKILETPGLSRLSQCGWQAAERKNFFWDMGKLQQRLLDLCSQRLKSREGVQRSLTRFDLLPELLKRVIIRRRG